jgi:hypothetical protein
MKHILNIIVVSLFILLGLSFFLESCYTPKYLEKRTNKACELCFKVKGNEQIIDSIYTITDTFTMPQDSALYQAYLRCIDGGIVIIHDTINQGKNIKIKTTLTNGYLRVKAKTDTFFIPKYIQGKERIINKPIYTRVEPKDYKTWKTLGIIGIISFSLLIIGIIIGIVIKIQK